MRNGKGSEEQKYSSWNFEITTVFLFYSKNFINQIRWIGDVINSLCCFKVKLFSTVQCIMIVCWVKKNFNSGGKNFLPHISCLTSAKYWLHKILLKRKGTKSYNILSIERDAGLEYASIHTWTFPFIGDIWIISSMY